MQIRLSFVPSQALQVRYLRIMTPKIPIIGVENATFLAKTAPNQAGPRPGNGALCPKTFLAGFADNYGVLAHNGN
jgi:hypothetical protein